MTRTLPWENVCRVLLGIILSFIAINALLTLTDDGFNISTELSDMVPSSDASAAQRLALEAARTTAEQSIILVLEAPDTSSLEQASSLVHDELAAMSDRLLVQDAERILDLIATNLASYRFHLLSQADKDTLSAGNVESVLERAIGDLYSPGNGLNLLPLNQDPFNFFSRYVEAGIGKLGMASDIETSSEDDLIASNKPVFREIINLQLRPPESKPSDQALIIGFFDHLDDVLGTRYPQVNTLRTGVLFYSAEAAADARGDINMISVGSIAGASLLMLLVFRSMRPLVTAGASIVVGVGFAFAVVHQLYGSIHVFTIVFGASLVGIVIDYSIHYYYHYAAGPVKGSDNRQLHRALLVSLLSSIAGFSALLFSNVVILQTIAVFSICGITAAWLTVLALSPESKTGIVKVRQHLINPIATVLCKAGWFFVDRVNERLALMALTLLFVGVVWFGKGQDDPRRFVNLSADLLQQGAQIGKITNDLEPGRFFIIEADSEQQLFDRLGILYANVGNLVHLVSVFDWLPSPRDQTHNYNLQLPLYQDAGLASSFFKATGIAPENFTALQTEYRQSSARTLTADHLFKLLDGQVPTMVLSTQKHDKQTVSLAAYVLMATGADPDKIRTRTSDIEGVTYIDTVVDSTAQLRNQRISSMWLLVLAYAVVGAIMWVLYRDRRAWVMTAVPAVSTVLTLGVLVLMGQPLTLFHTMSLFLILGLGMDYVVFLNEMTSDQRVTQQAIVLSALTSMLSFGLLALSSVPVAQAFGLTVLIGNSFNLLGTLAISRGSMWYRKDLKLQ